MRRENILELFNTVFGVARLKMGAVRKLAAAKILENSWTHFPSCLKYD